MTEAKNVRTKVVAYGERPITEFIILLSKEWDIINLLSHAQFLDGKQLNLEEGLENIFIEAPLGKNTGNPDILYLFKTFCIFCEVKTAPYEKGDVRERMEKQIPNYLKFLEEPKTKRDKPKPLVKKIIEKVEDKERYLICMSDDTSFPKALKDLINKQGADKHKIGWLSYRYFKDIAEKNGYNIKGEPPHIWMQTGMKNDLSNLLR